MKNFGKLNPYTAHLVSLEIDGHRGARINPMPANTHAQRGPTCGIYALGFVLQYWAQRLAMEGKPLANAPLPARKADLGGDKQVGVRTPGPAKSLREITKSTYTASGAPVTYLGEIFSGDVMASVATSAGFRATAHKLDRNTYLKKIYELLDKGIPPIVGVDVDADATKAGGGKCKLNNQNVACPGKFGGNNAHWITLVGYADTPCGRLLYQMNWGSYYKFLATSLRDSSEQLLKFGAQNSQVWIKQTLPNGTPVPLAQRGERWHTNLHPDTRAALRSWAPATSDSQHTRPNDKKEYALKTSVNFGADMYLTTIFPDVSLDLKFQVIEVTPAA